MQYAYVPVFPLISLFKLGTDASIKHSLKITDAQGITRTTQTKVPIVDSKAKEEAFLHFLYQFSCTPELMNWIDGATLLSKFELHLHGSYQDDWRSILAASDPNDDRDAAYSDEQVKNFLDDIFAEDEWSLMADYIWTRTKPTSMTTNTFDGQFWHLIETTQRLPHAPTALFPIREQKRIFLRMFPNQWVTNYDNSGKNTSDETLQSIRVYMNRQESLDPYQEDDHKTGQEDLEDDLEQ
jgi:hypothetical protein